MLAKNEAKKKLLAVGGKVSSLLLETAPKLVARIADEAKNKAKKGK